uniref:hypothetical protein n=1 Tax=Halolamina sp. TaxID=1940283 RepID=UPI00356A44E5
LATSVGLGATSGTVRAAHDDAQPEHVTIDFPEEEIQRYAPELVLSDDARSKLIDVYGWRARSTEFEDEVFVYWASYTHQTGWIGNLDSHLGDHEPLQVVVDEGTGDVSRVRASVYHWLKGEVLPSELVLTDETHPRLRVIDPWHQYSAVEEGRGGTIPAVVDLRGEWGAWLANGLEESVVPGASRNPWIMSTRGDWWRREYGFSTNEILVSATKAAGIGEVGSLED